jgi:LysM repeat protein
MCGHPIEQLSETDQDGFLIDETSSDPVPDGSALLAQDSGSRESLNLDEAGSQIVVSEMRERISPITFWLTALFAVIVTILGILVLMFPADAAVEFIPTSTPIPVVIGSTETATVFPTETPEPVFTATFEPSPAPVETPQPPRLHAVASGETLFGIGLRYSVSMESIASANTMPVDSDLQISQELLIPWPTATPPLVSVEIEVGGERIIADPANCHIYEIQRGDTLYGIAASFNVPSQAMLAVNRLTELSVLQPGDTICIPQVIYGSELPSTPGPSPTPGPTSPPPGPELLYPVAQANVETTSGVASLQWVTVKDLGEGEWYMVELTDLTQVDSHPMRAFTRQTSFQLPEQWVPQDPGSHDMRWRISIVRVTGQRGDGSFIYTFGGETSDDAFFRWTVSSG